MLIGDGDVAEQRLMVQRFALERLAYINSPQAGMAFRIGKLPYAILIDAAGFIRAKGLVNSREHLESLLIAQESGFATIQAYLASRGAAPDGAAPNGTAPDHPAPPTDDPHPSGPLPAMHARIPHEIRHP
jgi:hypothetical protein